MEFPDRVKVKVTTVGTGPYTLGDAVDGFQTLASSRVVDGINVPYTVTDGIDWETNYGLVSGSQLQVSRNELLDSSTGSAIDWPAGEKILSITLPGDILDDLVAINTANGFDLQAPDTMGTPSWDNVNKLYKLEPVSGQDDFSYRVDGRLKKHTSIATSEVMPSVTGTYYFYFNDVKAMKVINEDDISLDVFYRFAIVGLVYYNSVTGVGIPFEERHGYRMNSATHEMEHSTVGARHSSGLALTGLSQGADTFTGMTSGKFYDEDIPHTLLAQPTLPFIYREGAAGGWVWTTANNDVGYKDGGSYGVWNKWDGSVWSLQGGLPFTDHILIFTVGVKTLVGYSDGVKIIGQEGFRSAADARAAIESSRKKLITEGLPSPEFCFVGVHISHRSNGLVLLEDGSAYFDLRGTSSRGSASPSSSSLAADIIVDATGFDNNLSETDITTQIALQTINDQDFSTTVEDVLTSSSTENALSANQGKELKTLVDSKAPALGTDDNYVTDAEKTVIGNTSNTNTGDQDISGKENTGVAQGLMTSHESTHPLPTNRDTRNQVAGDYEPEKGANDNYVTDAEKTVIGNTSNTNTGDQSLSGLLTSVIQDTTPQLGGNLDLNGKALTAEYEAGIALAAGNLCYMDANGRMQKTDADSEITSRGFLVLCTESISAYSTGTFVLMGRLTGFSSLTKGGICYLSTSTGNITQTRPSGIGDFVRVIGYADSSTSIVFQPSPVWVKI